MNWKIKQKIMGIISMLIGILILIFFREGIPAIIAIPLGLILFCSKGKIIS